MTDSYSALTRGQMSGGGLMSGLGIARHFPPPLRFRPRRRRRFPLLSADVVITLTAAMLSPVASVQQLY